MIKIDQKHKILVMGPHHLVTGRNAVARTQAGMSDASVKVDMGPVVDKGLLADVYPMSTTRHNMFGWRYDAGLCAHRQHGSHLREHKSERLHRERKRLCKMSSLCI